MEIDEMIDTLKLFDQAGKSEESIIQTDLDSIRSTLFGKFYEGIIAKWLEDQENYKHMPGKPNVYWNETSPLAVAKTDLGKALNEALKTKKKNNFWANMDGVFEKDNQLYLWEAKNWAKWDEGKKLKQQVEDLLKSSPWLLADKIKHKGTYKELHGFIFSWWQEFEGHKDLEHDINKLINRPFAFYFTSNIIEDCRTKKYQWYQNLVNEQKKNIDAFFKELLGEQ